MRNIFLKKKTKISDLFIFTSKKAKDVRGSFQRLFCKKDLQKYLKKEIVQSNISINPCVGTFRGLHYQVGKFAEDKLVTCIQGSIFDISVDARKNSKTLGKSYTEVLSSKNQKLILIPKGVAHGFQTLESNTIVLYFHTNFFSPTSQKMINIKNKILKIKLPKKISLISERDKLEGYNELQKL